MSDGPRVPSLVWYCQKVAAANVDRLSGLGDSISFNLVRPVLESCSAETLMRIEDASPHLKAHTDELWQWRCSRDMPLDCEPYLNGIKKPPVSWRSLYEDRAALRAQKLAMAGSRLRNSRMDEEQRRKEKDVKLTGKQPLMKKARLWGAPTQPKTLFQKTRSEASKMQRVYDKQLRPPMPASKAYRTQLIAPLSGKPPLPLIPTSSTAEPTSRVIVRPIAVRSPEACRTSTSTPGASPPPMPISLVSLSAHASEPNSPATTKEPLSSPSPPSSSPPPGRQIRPLPSKQASALFMPKHRAHSQLSRHLAARQAQPST